MSGTPGLAAMQAGRLAPWLFNLFIDPKEEYPVGHRMNVWAVSLGTELKAHAETFRKYPLKDFGF